MFGSGWDASWAVTGNRLESQAVQFPFALFQEKVSMRVLFPSIFYVSYSSAGSPTAFQIS